MVDAEDSKSSAARRAGSSPAGGTNHAKFETPPHADRCARLRAMMLHEAAHQVGTEVGMGLEQEMGPVQDMRLEPGQVLEPRAGFCQLEIRIVPAP